jgi:RimJ/RimL family protein N-acetyltransferase
MQAMMDNRRSNRGTATRQGGMKRYRLAATSQERLVLDDGRELVLRPIAPADIDPIRAGFALLSPEEIRMRYQHPMKSLSEDYLHRLTHPHRGREIVLVVAEPLPPGDALIGAVARLSQVDGLREADFAILVSHFIAGHGVGKLLLKKLVTHARRRRLHAIHGDVLDENAPMLRLAETLGFHRESSATAGIVRVRLPLR